jgi:hypothetical protein
MSENVGASISRNPKGLHGLHGDNFTFFTFSNRMNCNRISDGLLHVYIITFMKRENAGHRISDKADDEVLADTWKSHIQKMKCEIQLECTHQPFLRS